MLHVARQITLRYRDQLPLASPGSLLQLDTLCHLNIRLSIKSQIARDQRKYNRSLPPNQRADNVAKDRQNSKSTSLQLQTQSPDRKSKQTSKEPTGVKSSVPVPGTKCIRAFFGSTPPFHSYPTTHVTSPPPSELSTGM